MTNNNWKNEYPLSVYAGETKRQLEEFISNLLTQKDQEHKAELDMIRGEIESKVLIDKYRTGYNFSCEDAISIIDKHLNK